MRVQVETVLSQESSYQSIKCHNRVKIDSKNQDEDALFFEIRKARQKSGKNKRWKTVGYLGKMMKVYDKSRSTLTSPSHFPEMECDKWGT